MPKRLPRLPVRRENDRLVFDEHPINLAGFVLKANEAVAVGRPSLNQWGAAFAFAVAAQEASPYWVGDLWNYAKGRQDWRDRLQQTLADVGRPLSDKTLANLGSISHAVKGRARDVSPSIAHSDVVVKLDPVEQVEWLEKARTEGWGQRDLRQNIRASRRRLVLEGQSVLQGLYRVFYVDYPWNYGDRPPSGSGAQQHYPSLSIDDGCKLPVAAHALSNAVMFFWVTAPMLYYSTDGIVPDAYRLLRAWDFTPKTGMVWDKVLSAGGNYAAIKHEHLIIATRGSCLPDRPVPMPDSVQVIRRTSGFEHSEKPEEFRKIIESMYDGPYLELFARKPTQGWDAYGNDARLWSRQEEAAS